MDDATSAIYSAFLVEEEGTASTFRALNEVFGRNGLPLSLHTDRGSHYFSTPEAGGMVDRTCLTQVGRALDHLGVEHIAAMRRRLIAAHQDAAAMSILCTPNLQTNVAEKFVPQ